MARVVTDDKHYKDIASKIRELSGYTDFKMPPSLMPAGVGYVYDVAYNKGYAEGDTAGYSRGAAEGGQVERDAFWNAYQKNGQRVNYDYAFAGDAAWTDAIFYPKHKIAPTSASYMFAKTGVTDLKGRLESLGIKLDFSKCTTVSNLFNSAVTVTRLPKMDFSAATNYASTFGWASRLVSIDEVVFNPSATAAANMFTGCTRLTDVIISGEIKVSGLTFAGSTSLSKASITSIIGALSKSTSGLSITFSKTAVNKAFQTASGANDGTTSAEWDALGGDHREKSNWNISLSD